MSNKDKVINNIVIFYSTIILFTFTYIKCHKFVCIFTYWKPVSAANIAAFSFIYKSAATAARAAAIVSSASAVMEAGALPAVRCLPNEQTLSNNSICNLLQKITI